MKSLGLVETTSIAFGIGLVDEMVKRADVEILKATTICSGRFMILVAGDRAAVGEAMEPVVMAGERIGSQHLLSKVSSQVVEVLAKRHQLLNYRALGIVECRNVIMGISSADVAVKAADVDLVKLVCGQGIKGKSYFILSGDVGDIEAGTRAAEEMLGKYLLNKKIIPSPDGAVLKAVI